jgi:hypothetical protein
MFKLLRRPAVYYHGGAETLISRHPRGRAAGDKIMQKSELAKFAGSAIYTLCTRMGKGYHGTMYAGQIYRITAHGTLRHVREVMSCVTSKKQQKEWIEFTGGNYVVGRPTAAALTIESIERLIK